jgi:hypothetical protein
MRVWLFLFFPAVDGFSDRRQFLIFLLVGLGTIFFILSYAGQTVGTAGAMGKGAGAADVVITAQGDS